MSVLSCDVEKLLNHCKTCSKVFRPDKLYNFVCYVCPYHTSQSVHMRPHIRRHLGHKPYKCSFCDYKSSEKNAVVVHMRIRHY